MLFRAITFAKKITPVILCGGSGTRLWPLSRHFFPKQFNKLSGKTNFSLFQETIKRIELLKNTTAPIIVCNHEHRFLVAEQCKEINIQPKDIILEPTSKNTAPAILLSALRVYEEGDNNLLILSSDHILENKKQFLDTIENSLSYTNDGKIVLFGVLPNRAETGYGYIKVQSVPKLNDHIAQKIINFTEKPTIDVAKNFLKDGKYLWNSGIFIFKISTLFQEMEKFSKDIFEIIKKAYSKKQRDLDFLRVDNDTFEQCESISIDNAIMEKTNLGFVLPLDKGWSDIGTWHSLWESSEKDNDNNCLIGRVHSKDNRNCYFRSDNRLLVTLGLENIVVIETDDVVFVGDINRSQGIKEIVNNLRKDKIKESYSHMRAYRPWGNYKTMLEGDRWQVKIITVNPGSSLSLQMHHHRAEHWIVVKGTAEVELDGEKTLLSENQSIHIPLGSKHRLSNPGKLSLELIEVQSGAYLDEDDIIRFEDIFNRK